MVQQARNDHGNRVKPARLAFNVRLLISSAPHGVHMPNYFGLDDFGVDSFAADTDAAAQLQQIFGAGQQQDINALMADALAADMMFGADSPQAVATKAKVVGAMRAKAARGPSPQMQALQKMALAHQAGKSTFSTTSEDNSTIKAEILPIPRTTIPKGGQFTLQVRPTRSMQINTIRFPSDRTATSACRLEDVAILGTSQMNGPGGVACSGLTEVRTAPVLKGSTAQAGQDILVTISNTDLVNDQVIEGWFEGPDIVRST